MKRTHAPTAAARVSHVLPGHAGITGRQCVIHSLRHTCATRLLETVGAIKLVQEWLGHTSILTTAKTYAHVQTHWMVDAAALLSAARHLGSE